MSHPREFISALEQGWDRLAWSRPQAHDPLLDPLFWSIVAAAYAQYAAELDTQRVQLEVEVDSLRHQLQDRSADVGGAWDQFVASMREQRKVARFTPVSAGADQAPPSADVGVAPASPGYDHTPPYPDKAVDDGNA